MSDEEELLPEAKEYLDKMLVKDQPPPEVVLPDIVDSDDIKEMAKSMTPHVMRELFMIALDDSNTTNARIAAINTIIDRGHGKAAGEAPSVEVKVNVSEMKPDDLARRLQFLDELKKQKVIEGEVLN